MGNFIFESNKSEHDIINVINSEIEYNKDYLSDIDFYGKTPLAHAMDSFNLFAVKILIEKFEVNKHQIVYINNSNNSYSVLEYANLIYQQQLKINHDYFNKNGSIKLTDNDVIAKKIVEYLNN